MKEALILQVYAMKAYKKIKVHLKVKFAQIIENLCKSHKAYMDQYTELGYMSKAKTIQDQWKILLKKYMTIWGFEDNRSNISALQDPSTFSVAEKLMYD